MHAVLPLHVTGAMATLQQCTIVCHSPLMSFVKQRMTLQHAYTCFICSYVCLRACVLLNVYASMPCEWKGNSMIVCELVRVDSPYTPKHASLLPTATSATAPATLQRVKTVLEKERNKLGMT